MGHRREHQRQGSHPATHPTRRRGRSGNSLRRLIGLALAAGLAACGGGGSGAIFVVNSANDVDDGVCDASHCSLREAINAANAQVGTNEIHFDIGGGGVQTISPTSPLPDLTDAVVIDGTTQPGFAGAPIIELNGSGTPAGTNGLTIMDYNCIVRGLVINRFASGAGIAILDGEASSVEGSYIGTNVSGAAARPNRVGVMVTTLGNRIGGLTPELRNVISGNTEQGILIEGRNNMVQGNFIGVDATGAGPLGNGAQGVFLLEALENGIGSNAVGGGNVISANGSDGVYIHYGCGNGVYQNMIGTDAAGMTALGNGRHGVMIAGAYPGGCATTNNIGWSLPLSGNVISGNARCGIYLDYDADETIVQANFIGTDRTGMVELGNGTEGVFIHSGNNLIGGTTPEARNVISGNTIGVFIASELGGNQVFGNYIGTDVNGTAALGNSDDGVELNETSGNWIGDNILGAGNLISGNAYAGVRIVNASHNQLLGNLIGTDASGTLALGNEAGGVMVGGSHNSIGNGGPNGGNVISGNLEEGIMIAWFLPGVAVDNVVAGNLIGLDRTGLVPLGNGGDGIIVMGDANIIGGPDVGANYIAGNGGDGIYIRDGTGITIQGNFIGTDVPGGLGLANAGNGITVEQPNNLIGGSGDGEGNLISGNDGAGVAILGGTANRVEGNIIGTDQAGGLIIGNGEQGVLVIGDANTIGGPAVSARNLISGNYGNGIDIDGDDNIIQNNYIGTDIAGSGMIGNEMGIFLEASASGNMIGGTGAGNFVAFNRSIGVSIGVPPSAEPPGTGNQMLNNSVFANGGLGIDLAEAGVNPNDTGDPDTGVNLRQNYPVLVSAITDGVHTAFTGTLNSTPNTVLTVQYFTNNECDPSGYGEGRRLVRTSAVTTNASGLAQIFEDFPSTTFAIPQYVTATATDPAGNTSEFSNCIPVTEGPIVEPAPEGSLSGNAFCRLGPGTAYFARETFNQGQALMVAGRSADGRPLWFWVETPDGSGHCWVSDAVFDFPGAVESLVVIDAPHLPDAPTGLTIARRICGVRQTYTILLQWADVATDETGYRVYRNGELLASLAAGATMYTDLPPAGGPYTYEVEAVNAYGASPRASVTEVGCP